jgi:hypothetical protein
MSQFQCNLAAVQDLRMDLLILFPRAKFSDDEIKNALAVHNGRVDDAVSSLMDKGRSAEQAIAISDDEDEVEHLDPLRVTNLAVESSLHGQQRRGERNIYKRDLQAAVAHGAKEQGMPCRKTGEPRWKFTFADVVYITDATATREITSWTIPLPLRKAKVSEVDEDMHRSAKLSVAKDPSYITSHSVLVVDQSGSMKESDVDGHRSRSHAAYYTIATEFIAKRLSSAASDRGDNAAALTDVVSIIEMRDTARVIFKAEPMSWVLHNMIVTHREQHRPCSHGNYIPSLVEACKLLNGAHDTCALMVLFLSDGKPSDKLPKGRELSVEINSRVSELCSPFSARLTFGTVGFSKPTEAFTILSGMASEAKRFCPQSSFQRAQLDANALGAAVSTLASSLTQTRTQLTALGGGPRVLRRVARETVSESRPHRSTCAGTRDVGWSDVGSSDVGWSDVGSNPSTTSLSAADGWKLAYQRSHKLRRAVWSHKDRGWRYVPFAHEHAAGIAERTKPYDQGAERLAYGLCEVDEFAKPVGPDLVAKQDKFVSDGRVSELDYHEVFCRTQQRSARFAQKFNRALDLLRVSPSVPRIHFLDCCVYLIQTTSGSCDRGLLAEKRLDDMRYKKWNDNYGHVDGRAKVGSVRFANEIGPIAQQGEGEEEEAEEAEEAEVSEGGIVNGVLDPKADSDEEEFDDTFNYGSDSSFRSHTRGDIPNEDIPQAFTHYTYRMSKRKVRVFQPRVLTSSLSPPSLPSQRLPPSSLSLSLLTSLGR